jgi:hypothetical protein
MRVTGIYLSLSTGPEPWAGTDDALYLGLAGTVGGREFFIDTGRLAANSTKTFKWGDASFNADVEKASVGGTIICRPNLTHVYLRKHGLGSRSADNAWKLQNAFVYIVSDDSATTDVFVTTGPEQLSYETGLIVYLAQTAHLGEFMNRQIPVVDGPASCGRDDEEKRRAVIERATQRS